jgi:SAM-dependent methyltransferase
VTTSKNQQTYTQAFYDVQGDGSLRSARVILSELFLLCDAPQTVIDVGCGVGTWLLALSEQGVTEFFGLDGDWVPREQLRIPPERYIACDISAGPVLVASLPRKHFDLVVSLEVAEHLPPDKAGQFVSLLCELGEVVLFSAAIPGQGGIDHINEAWPAQWAELFAEHKFFCFDLLRSRVWMNPDVDFWYAQNVLIFARSESKAYSRLSQVAAAVDAPLSIVHPRKLFLLQTEATNLRRGLSEALTQKGARPFFEHLAEIQRLEDKVETLRLMLSSAGIPGFNPNTLAMQVQARADTYRAENDGLKLQMDGILKHAAALEAELARLRTVEENSRNLVNALDRVTIERDVALREVGEWKQKTSGIFASWSWRITAPLRRLADALRNLRTH